MRRSHGAPPELEVEIEIEVGRVDVACGQSAVGAEILHAAGEILTLAAVLAVVAAG